MGRKCSVVGCSSYGGLHIFPQDLNIRRQWLRLIGLWDDFELPPKAGVCKLHFRRDSFANLMAFEEGFAKKLLLKSDEVPALALPLRRSGVERQRPPTLLPRQHKDLEHKLEPKVTREIGCQTDPVISRHACIQANLKPSEGIEEITPEISPQKRKEGEASASELCLDVNDSASAVSCLSALSDIPPYKQKKYIVYEDQLLKIFQSCPVCANRCTVDTITTGTLLRVSLLCPRCEYCSQWSSQPTENGIPLGNLQLCAAVLFTGSSFHQISKFLGAFNIQGLSKQGFYRYQAKLLRDPTVSWQRGLEQDELVQETNDGRSVTPDGDMCVDSPDVQKLLVFKDEVPDEEQYWCNGLDQEDQKPPQIKEEQEDSEITEFVFDPVCVKSEDEEEKPQPSELHSQPEDNRDSAGPGSDHEEDSFETDVSDGNWEGSIEAPSCSDSVRINKDPVADKVCEESKKLHSCSECGKTFKLKWDLLRHRRIHTGEKPYSCSVCKASFTWKHILVQHMRTHSGEKPFSCSVCGQTFRKKETLTYHMSRHSDEKPFSCSVCGQTFSRKESVIRHMICHSENKPFSCSVCGQKFRRKESVTRHMKRHTKEKPFSCSICRRAFTSKITLLGHTKVHAENRPFKCSVCDAAFKKKGTLSEHARIHTGEKACSCWICGQSLSSKSYLTIHMRSHTGEKPYSCSVCKATFKWKPTFVRHSKTHADQLPSP